MSRAHVLFDYCFVQANDINSIRGKARARRERSQWRSRTCQLDREGSCASSSSSSEIPAPRPGNYLGDDSSYERPAAQLATSTPPPLPLYSRAFWNKPALSDLDSKSHMVDLEKRVGGWAPPTLPVRSSEVFKTTVLVADPEQATARQRRMRPAARPPEGTCLLRSQWGSFYFG
jgi:hypothetical protein